MNKKHMRIVEAALFSAGRAVSIEKIQDATSLKKEEIRKVLTLLIEEFKKRSEKEETSLEVSKAGEKYVIQLRANYAQYGKKLAKTEVPKKLLKALSLVVYYQPIKQSELKGMVGSSVYEYVKELKELGFIKAKRAGRTYSLETTEYFYEYFGFDTTDKEAIRRYVVKKLQG